MADSFKSVSPASAVTFNEENLSVGSAEADFDPSQLPESTTGRRRLMSRDVFCMVVFPDSQGILHVCGCPVNKCQRKNPSSHRALRQATDQGDVRANDGSYVTLPPTRANSSFQDGDASTYLSPEDHAAELDRITATNRAAAASVAAASPITTRDYSGEEDDLKRSAFFPEQAKTPKSHNLSPREGQEEEILFTSVQAELGEAPLRESEEEVSESETQYNSCEVSVSDMSDPGQSKPSHKSKDGTQDQDGTNSTVPKKMAPAIKTEAGASTQPNKAAVQETLAKQLVKNQAFAKKVGQELSRKKPAPKLTKADRDYAARKPVGDVIVPTVGTALPRNKRSKTAKKKRNPMYHGAIHAVDVYDDAHPTPIGLVFASLEGAQAWAGEQELNLGGSSRISKGFASQAKAAKWTQDQINNMVKAVQEHMRMASAQAPSSDSSSDSSDDSSDTSSSASSSSSSSSSEDSRIARRRRKKQRKDKKKKSHRKGKGKHHKKRTGSRHGSTGKKASKSKRHDRRHHRHKDSDSESSGYSSDSSLDSTKDQFPFITHDESKGKKGKLFGEDNTREYEVLKALCPKGVDKKTREELADCISDGVALPGKYYSVADRQGDNEDDSELAKLTSLLDRSGKDSSWKKKEMVVLSLCMDLKGLSPFSPLPMTPLLLIPSPPKFPATRYRIMSNQARSQPTGLCHLWFMCIRGVG